MSWQFLSSDILSFEQIPQPLFDENGQLVDGSEDGNYVGREVDFLITTFAQVRKLKMKSQHIPRDWIVWIDDPVIADIVDIDPYDSKRWGGLSHDQFEEKTYEINGKRYYRRPNPESLGYNYRFHKCTYTTTEALTLEALKLMMMMMRRRRRLGERVVHDRMHLLVGGWITVLRTEKVYKRYHGVIPLITRRLNKSGYPTILIADGLESDINHSNNKGKNYLNDMNIFVELSTPHPNQIRMLCDALGKSFKKSQNEVIRLLMLNRMHQAIGRNSGYRH